MLYRRRVPTLAQVAALIIINGPPGCGKSTIAQRYADDHPLALNLDIDKIRAMLGGWQRNRGAAGQAARSIALVSARTHLAAGHDVLISQFLGRLTFLEQAEHLAAEAGAGFREVVLMDSKANALRRFAERSADATDPVSLDARDHIAGLGGPAELARMYDRVLAVIAARPGAQVVHTASGAVDQAYQDFLRCLPDQPG
jgi:predicted kinase